MMRTAQTGAMAFAALLTVAIAGTSADRPSVEMLVARIPDIAHNESSLDGEECRLADDILARGAPAIPFLLPLLNDRRPAVRNVAGYVVSRIDGLGEEHLDALLTARDARDGWLPYGIGRIGTPRAVAFLVDDLLARPQSETQVT